MPERERAVQNFAEFLAPEYKLGDYHKQQLQVEVNEAIRISKQLTVQFFRISQYGAVRIFIKDEEFKKIASKLTDSKSIRQSEMNHIKDLFALAGVTLKFQEVPAYEGITQEVPA